MCICEHLYCIRKAEYLLQIKFPASMEEHDREKKNEAPCGKILQIIACKCNQVQIKRPNKEQNKKNSTGKKG